MNSEPQRVAPKMYPAHSSANVGVKGWVAWVVAGVLGVTMALGASAAILYHDLASRVSASVLDVSHLNPDAETKVRRITPTRLPGVA